MRNILLTEHDDGETTFRVIDEITDGSDAVITFLAEYIAQREQALIKLNRLYN